jgi:hypothetical protein
MYTYIRAVIKYPDLPHQEKRELDPTASWRRGLEERLNLLDRLGLARAETHCNHLLPRDLIAVSL